MASRIRNEVERLERVFDQIGLQWKSLPGATAAEIAFVEQKVGISFDDDLKALWRLSNGSNRQNWFAKVFAEVEADPYDFTPCSFLSIGEALKWWSTFEPYDDAIYREWFYDGSWGDRDVQVQPTFLRHRLWFPFTEELGSNVLFFDADPTIKGQYGQIIRFVHDPDQIDYVAPSFIDFFHRSNNLLEESLREYPENLREILLR
jgi:internalin A